MFCFESQVISEDIQFMEQKRSLEQLGLQPALEYLA